MSDRWALSTETLAPATVEEKPPPLMAAGASEGNKEAVWLVGHLFGGKPRAPTR